MKHWALSEIRHCELWAKDGNFYWMFIHFVPCSNLSSENLEIFGGEFSGAIHTSKSVEYFAGFSAITTIKCF